MKKIYLLILSFGISVQLSAQRPDSFPTNPNGFLTVMETYMTESKNKDLEAAFDAFKEVFGVGAFSEIESTRIMQTCNLMLQKRMSNNPYFRVYLNILPLLKRADAEGKRFDEWQGIYEQLLKEGTNYRDIKRFVDLSTFFLDKGFLSGSPGGTTWLASSPDYHFTYQDSSIILTWEETNLKAYRKNDTMAIQGTQGAFNLLTNQWIGKRGKVYWDSTGLGDDIYAELFDYQIDIQKSLYEVDSVRFFLPSFFGSKGIIGSFSDRINNLVGNQVASYPRFTSKEAKLEIDNFGEGIKYVGGLSLEGGTIYGTGNQKNKAKIDLYNEKNQKVFAAAGDRFVIKQGTELSGQNLNGVFYYQQDSISHPSVAIKFDFINKQLELRREESGNGRNLFFSSAHRVNINTDYIIANFNSDSLGIGKKSARILKKAPVSFESLNFFDRREYEQLQGLSAVSPLVVLLKASRDRGDAQFLKAKDISALYGGQMSEASLTNLLYKLSGKGFINYESSTGDIEIKDKLHHYLKAYSSQGDFDRIKIISDTLETNAYLDLSDNTIQVQGVKQLEFSPLKRVAVLPDSNRLNLLPGMNIDFDGTLFAGFAELQGKGFHFDYQRFLIGMDSIRSLLFFPKENNNAFALTSIIEDANGTLLIDAPGNKSGLDTSQALTIFPTFTTKNPSYVYYDDSTRVSDTAYSRNNFYLELAPFALNRLNDFVKEDLNFPSTLYSADIFPPIQENALVRPDYSLGFEHQTSEEGYPMYQEKGTYKGKLDISNGGFLGVGQIEFLGASIGSEDFIFRPLSTQGSAKAFDLPESKGGAVETPKVHADQVEINWLPYKDSLYIRSEQFDLFQEPGYSLKGLLTLTPGGVKGRGTLSWAQADLSSEFFSFGASTVNSDSMDIFIKSLEAQDALALETKNFRGTVDFDKQIGAFQGNDTSYIQLNHNQYISTLNGFQWDMGGEQLTLQRSDNGPGIFTSTVQGQDSLNFLGKNARIDLKNNNLLIQEVPLIRSADALIYPDSNLVVVKPGGLIRTLKNATIVADSIDKTHKIVRADVDITGRKTYTAQGYYEYNIGDRQQEILFSNIVGERVGKGKISERPTATRASGNIMSKDSFFIDKKTSFYGDINLYSESVNLEFKGFAKLNAEKLPKQTWFGINCQADKNNLIIPYNHPRDAEGFQVFSGFFLGRDMPIVYPLVMAPPITLQDRKILDVTGIFKYDKQSDQFIFGDSSKITMNNPRGNFLNFNNRNGKVSAEGKLNLLDKLKFTSLDAVGTIESSFVEVPDSLRGKTPPPPVEIEIMSGVRFTLPDRLFRYIMGEVERNSLSLQAIPYLANQEKYKKQLSMLFPDSKELNEGFASMALGRIDLPKKVNDYTILLSDLKMKWDMDYQSFVSTNPQVGVVSINGEGVNRRMEAYVEYKMPGIGGDRFYYYLKFPSQIFYYFGFKQGVLEVYSNDSQFMDAASSMKKNELVVKMSGGETYEILVETASRANMFVRRVKAVK